MSLVFVSEAASKADLYFPCKGGQIYCAGCLVIYGAGGAPWPLPRAAGTGQEAAALLPLAEWEWHRALPLSWHWHTSFFWHKAAALLSWKRED